MKQLLFAFSSARYNQLPTSTLLTLLSVVIKVVSTFGGPECRLGLAGEAGNESRFLTDSVSFSVIPFFSAGLCNLDLALADLVGTM
jgi:hypothetical protein